MNKELQHIIQMTKESLQDEPWYGKSVYTVLDEIDPAIVYKKPEGSGHSIADLLYHMILWVEFTLERLEKTKAYDKKYYSENDWRQIDPVVHTWQKGVKEYKDINKKILDLLESKDDSLLKEKVDFRDYDFRYLLHGIIQHNIYHTGQIVYVNKLLQKDF